jgi:hypothetical protein
VVPHVVQPRRAWLQQPPRALPSSPVTLL